MHKRACRGGHGNRNVIEVVLPMGRSKGPGNKRWYRIEDFQEVVQALNDRRLSF